MLENKTNWQCQNKVIWEKLAHDLSNMGLQKAVMSTSHGPQELTTKKNYKTTNGMIILRIN